MFFDWVFSGLAKRKHVFRCPKGRGKVRSSNSNLQKTNVAQTRLEVLRKIIGHMSPTGFFSAITIALQKYTISAVGTFPENKWLIAELLEPHVWIGSYSRLQHLTEIFSPWDRATRKELIRDLINYIR